MTAPSWHSTDPDQAATRLDTDAHRGLEAAEVDRRLARYGPNSIEATGATPWYRVLGRQFVDVLIFILAVAAAVSFALGETVDAITISVIMVLNGVFGFAQEWRAERAIEALQGMLAQQASVVRDDRIEVVDAAGLVPGDVVVIEVGVLIPADLRIVEAVDLTVDESALTGESESVAKSTAAVDPNAPLAERPSMAWMGTSVTNGRARGIAVATGEQTEFGRIAVLTRTVGREPTPLQRQLATLGKWLGVLAIALSLLVAVVGWLSGHDLREMFFTGVSLAVAVVPEGLPAVVTITLALGIRRMTEHRALLRRLQAAETLGSATVICTDKTGTLTQNEMTVRKIWVPTGVVEATGVGYSPDGAFLADTAAAAELAVALETGVWCNHARVEKDDRGWRAFGEPTEAALITAAAKAGVDVPTQPAGEFSFSSSRKRMTIIEDAGPHNVAHVKGAPEVILDRCVAIGWGDSARQLDEASRNQIKRTYESFAVQGYRTLALARRRLPEGIEMAADPVEQQLSLLGVAAILDPPRTEVPEAVAQAHGAGIKVVVITGDAPETARAIAERVGLQAEEALTGMALDGLSDAMLRDAISAETVFARTTPEHKLRIVELLQRDGAVVAMTGDGVNDAPALKKADIGIAMGLRGTDVARGAADLVLTDDNFASIVGAVAEGRRQYDNIQKFIRYLLSSNTGEVIAVLTNILLQAPLILLPVQILWMNLVTDGLTALALGVEPAEDDIMKRSPRDPRQPILTRESVANIIGFGAYVGIGSLFLFHLYNSGFDQGLVKAQTMAFTGMVALEHMNVFNFRSLHSPMRQVGFFSNPWLLAAWSLTILLQVAVVYVPFLQTAFGTVPLDLSDWLWVLAVSVPIFVGGELIKMRRSRR
jgi:Ca2+-transporting ATPase